jgi:hypothetical protein
MKDGINEKFQHQTLKEIAAGIKFKHEEWVGKQ